MTPEAQRQNQILAAFESPRVCLMEAKDALKEFDTLLSDWNPDSTFEILEQEHNTPNQKRVLLRPLKFPERLNGKASSVIKWLRDALDQAVWTATSIIEHHPSDWDARRTNFPSAKSEDHFDGLFEKRGPCGDLSKSLMPLLRSFEPWPGKLSHPGEKVWPAGPNRVVGNDMLKNLLDSSNVAKHRHLLAASPIITEMTIEEFTFSEVVYASVPPRRIVGTDDHLIAIVPNDATYVFASKIEFETVLHNSVSSRPNATATQELSQMLSICSEIVRDISQQTIIEEYKAHR
ncbi:hypothetical protein [uncultured Tateyamaria sp.]|uniref:hypothetical protein n=1 Tax=uncultured Tateyamaria sp. TaxID=455651 RepID=UPI00260FE10B|nr:hypothetical protein [uncultured Tateyamaria sp.]